MAPVHTRRLRAPSPPTAAHKLLVIYSQCSAVAYSCPAKPQFTLAHQDKTDNRINAGVCDLSMPKYILCMYSGCTSYCQCTFVSAVKCSLEYITMVTRVSIFLGQNG